VYRVRAVPFAWTIVLPIVAVVERRQAVLVVGCINAERHDGPVRRPVKVPKREIDGRFRAYVSPKVNAASLPSSDERNLTGSYGFERYKCGLRPDHETCDPRNPDV
jgi:hypothetical protein